MGKSLVIVESPAKAKTINKYLGNDFIVKSSVGHIRDLPTKAPASANDPKARAAEAAKFPKRVRSHFFGIGMVWASKNYHDDSRPRHCCTSRLPLRVRSTRWICICIWTESTNRCCLEKKPAYFFPNGPTPLLSWRFTSQPPTGYWDCSG